MGEGWDLLSSAEREEFEREEFEREQRSLESLGVGNNRVSMDRLLGLEMA